MFILRRICKDGSQVNTCLGEFYVLEIKETNPKPFSKTTNKTSTGGSTKTAKEIEDLMLSMNSGYNGIADLDVVNPKKEGYYINLEGGLLPNFGNTSLPEGYNMIYY